MFKFSQIIIDDYEEMIGEDGDPNYDLLEEIEHLPLLVN